MSLRVAVVGCGAVAQAHLPVLESHPGCELAAVVDRDLARARDVARAHGVATAAGDFAEVVGDVDAAVLCLPHHLHAPVAVACLERGLHVLVEKPMAMTAAECDAMIAAARKASRVLAVGMLRRFYAGSQVVKNVLERGLLGRIESFEVREGFVYDWPVASDFMFRRETGGGVLADTGAHVLDMLLWWLGEVESFEYRDDALGGVEADCELRLVLRGGARGLVELSRTRALPNRWILRGSGGELELQTKFDPELRLRLEGSPHALLGHALRDGLEREDPLGVFRRQLDDFVEAARTGREPFVGGAEARRAVALIEACHAQRRPLERAWESWEPPPLAGGRS